MSQRASGVALPVALILLAALALLGVAGLGSAVAAYAVAAHDLRRAQAFEAAELATRAALATGDWLSAHPGAPTRVEAAGLAGVAGTAVVAAIDEPAADNPLEGFSLGEGGSGFRVAHFTVTATGTAPLGATVVLEQGFSVIVPAR